MAVETPFDSTQHLEEMDNTIAQLEPRRDRRWLTALKSNRFALAAAIVIVLLVVMAIFAPLVAPYDPKYIDPSIRLLGPSAEHRFGTDDFGRDMLSRVIYGARVSLLIGAGVTLFSALIGAVLGLVAGYYPRIDTPIMRLMDGMMAFPSILLAIAIMASLGPSTRNVFIALTIVYVPTIARLVRGSTLVIKQQPFVESARCVGMRDHSILGKYVFPNALSPLIVQCTFVLAFAIISEASLSFLGAGVPPDQPSWGNMLRDGQKLIQRAWWMAVFPGIFLVITVLAFNILGDGLRDALDPRAQER
ncbi:MAG: ABC transporter permease [Thermomicrobiales bacterium]|nr:ABC transporter permease [Thermomicrobiales bacterium]